jgi:hypothetical protein
VEAALARCEVCGAAFCAPGKPARSATRKGLAVPTPRKTGRPSARRWPLRPILACVLLGGVGLLLLVFEVRYLEAGRRREDTHWANENLAATVEKARTLAASHQWDQAAKLLREGLADKEATQRQDAETLLQTVLHGRAASQLTAAEQAVQHKDLSQARDLLKTYLANPAATDKERATHLQAELALATSTDEADALLRPLSDARLAAVAAGNNLPSDGLSNRILREVHASTLRARATLEQRRRADLRIAQEAAARRARQERQKREARIQATPAFRELTAFVDRTRKQYASAQTDPHLMDYLFRELKLNSPEEQHKALVELTTPPESAASLTNRVSQERATLKEQFRQYRDFDATDREVFGRLVDEQLDRLLQDLTPARPAAGGGPGD